jgi:hypothetical protein
MMSGQHLGDHSRWGRVRIGNVLHVAVAICGTTYMHPMPGLGGHTSTWFCCLLLVEVWCQSAWVCLACTYNNDIAVLHTLSSQLDAFRTRERRILSAPHRDVDAQRKQFKLKSTRALEKQPEYLASKHDIIYRA